MAILVKAKNLASGEFRRFTVPEFGTEFGFSQFSSKLKDVFNLEIEFQIKYKDDEEDVITIGTDDELLLASVFAIADKSPKLFRVLIEPVKPVKQPQQQQQQQQSSSSAQASAFPNIEVHVGGLDGVSGFLNNMGGLFGVAETARQGGGRRRGCGPWERGFQPQGMPFGGPLGGILGGPFGGMFDGPLGGAFGGCEGMKCSEFIDEAKKINPELLSKLEVIVPKILENCHLLLSLVAVVPDTMLFVFELLKSEESDSTVVEKLLKKVQDILNGNQSISDTLRSEIVDLIADFSKDAAVLKLLELVRSEVKDNRNKSGASPKKCPSKCGSSKSSEKDSFGGNNVYPHWGVVCDGCERGISGVRYKCLDTPDYDLCENCKFAGVHAGHPFRAIQFPWDNENVVPEAPSTTWKFFATGVDIMHLQHVLIKLGYLEPKALGYRGFGRFGPRTRSALQRMQREFGLKMGPYDDITATTLLSILESKAASESSPKSSSPVPEPVSPSTSASSAEAKPAQSAWKIPSEKAQAKTPADDFVRFDEPEAEATVHYPVTEESRPSVRSTSDTESADSKEFIFVSEDSKSEVLADDPAVEAVEEQPDVESQYASALKQLELMGFTNKELNLELCEKFDGNLRRIVPVILDN